jgi:hypothetical protein
MTMYALCHVSRSVALACDQWRAAKAVTLGIDEIMRRTEEDTKLLAAKRKVKAMHVQLQRQQGHFYY